MENPPITTSHRWILRTYFANDIWKRILQMIFGKYNLLTVIFGIWFKFPFLPVGLIDKKSTKVDKPLPKLMVTRLTDAMYTSSGFKVFAVLPWTGKREQLGNYSNIFLCHKKSHHFYTIIETCLIMRKRDHIFRHLDDACYWKYVHHDLWKRFTMACLSCVD